ncbi:MULTISPECIES: hypothetical protein [unclassified Streptomyces]|nr:MULTISPECIES: hypothetical protein [unclassified Streptomyces]WSR23651.1 hypothetical protein OG573_34270 [Streptomyces sp. NBC_01205]
MNLTDAPIRAFGDPFRVIPATLPVTRIGVLATGYGTHVTGFGSFLT